MSNGGFGGIHEKLLAKLRQGSAALREICMIRSASAIARCEGGSAGHR